MAVALSEITRVLEELAPKWLCAKWDNSGLQLGDAKQEVNRVLVTLDADSRAVKAAVDWGADLIISHHPLYFEPLKSIDYSTAIGHITKVLIERKIAVYSLHTNLDSASKGLNQYVAEKMGLLEIKGLGVEQEENLFKLVVFVPAGHVRMVMEALGEAGAGHIGKYSHTSFRVLGQGTFKPLPGARPYLGTVGQMEEVEEYRLETVVPQPRLKKVLEAMLRSHPYEEVAYDVYPLANRGFGYSMGRVGLLAETTDLQGLALKVKELFELEGVRIVGPPTRSVKKVGVVTGTGIKAVSSALKEGCDVLITGDIKYHEALAAFEAGLALIDAGHDGLENAAVDFLGGYLEEQKRLRGWKLEIGKRKDFLFTFL